MPNVPIFGLPPSHVDPEVHGLKIIFDCPKPGSSRATYRLPPIGRWSKCGGNDTVMVLLGSGTSKGALLNLHRKDFLAIFGIVGCHSVIKKYPKTSHKRYKFEQ